MQLIKIGKCIKIKNIYIISLKKFLGLSGYHFVWNRGVLNIIKYFGNISVTRVLRWLKIFPKFRTEK